MRKKGEKEGGMSVFTSLFMKLFALAMRRSDDKRDRGLQEPSSLTAYRDVRYAPSGGKEHLLDVYTTAEEGETLPALVSVHGGGFCYGDKERYRFYCMRLALQGYTVFNFNYRLLPARFPAPLEDLNDVMLFLAAHAREYRAKADEVYAVGDSAGALILSVYAGITSSPAYAANYAFSPPLRLCAVALHSGLFDVGKGVEGFSAHAVREWTKGNRAALRLLSAREFVTAAYPPAFLSYSVNDPIAQATPAFAALLRARGVKCEVAKYGQGDKSAGHVFHLDVRSPLAADCNRRQHEFFTAIRCT